jgi:hypothetical protein
MEDEYKDPSFEDNELEIDFINKIANNYIFYININLFLK